MLPITFNMRIILMSLLTFLPIVASAAIVPCNGPDCTPCDVAKLAQNILTFLVEISVILATIGIAWSGLRYMVMSGGDEGAVRQAKEMFTNVVVGLVIVLAAWLIVDTVIKLFVNQSVIGPWNQIQCTGGLQSVTSSTQGQPTGANVVAVPAAGGNQQQVTFTPTQSDSVLSGSYASVNSTYQNQINSACQSSGTSIPNCSTLVTALIANESSGDLKGLSGLCNFCLKTAGKYVQRATAHAFKTKSIRG